MLVRGGRRALQAASSTIPAAAAVHSLPATHEQGAPVDCAPPPPLPPPDRAAPERAGGSSAWHARLEKLAAAQRRGGGSAGTSWRSFAAAPLAPPRPAAEEGPPSRPQQHAAPAKQQQQQRGVNGAPKQRRVGASGGAAGSQLAPEEQGLAAEDLAVIHAAAAGGEACVDGALYAEALAGVHSRIDAVCLHGFLCAIASTLAQRPASNPSWNAAMPAGDEQRLMALLRERGSTALLNAALRRVPIIQMLALLEVLPREQQQGEGSQGGSGGKGSGSNSSSSGSPNSGGTRGSTLRPDLATARIVLERLPGSELHWELDAALDKLLAAGLKPTYHLFLPWATLHANVSMVWRVAVVVGRGSVPATASRFCRAHSRCAVAGGPPPGCAKGDGAGAAAQGGAGAALLLPADQGEGGQGRGYAVLCCLSGGLPVMRLLRGANWSGQGVAGATLCTCASKHYCAATLTSALPTASP